MKHTPGPWKVDERVGCIAIYPENETFNCLDQPLQNFIAYWYGYKDKNETWQVYEKDKANARLIAAAPELLEALTKIANAERKDGNYDKYDAAGFVRIAQLGISKAEGRDER